MRITSSFSITSVCSADLFALALLIAQAGRGVLGQTLKGNDCTAAGAYTLCQNLWGADSGVGSQTTTLHSSDGNDVSWETEYTWSNGPNNVKSYPNVYHNTAKGMQLQDIVSAPTTWKWKYQSAANDLRADVSYDIWTGVPQSGNVASSASSYEIMIWLSNRGPVGGIGNTVASGLQLGGHKFDLKHGPNSNWDVFSFITAEGDITDFDADLNDFFQYLVKEQGVAKTQYLQAIQAGTEPFTGSANLLTTSFTVDVSTEEDSSSSAAPPPKTTSSSTKTHTSSPSPSASTTSTEEGNGGGESTSVGSSTSSTSSAVQASETSGASTGSGSGSGSGSGAANQCRLTAKRGSLLRRKTGIFKRMFQ